TAAAALRSGGWRRMASIARPMALTSRLREASSLATPASKNATPKIASVSVPFGAARACSTSLLTCRSSSRDRVQPYTGFLGPFEIAAREGCALCPLKCALLLRSFNRRPKRLFRRPQALVGRRQSARRAQPLQCLSRMPASKLAARSGFQGQGLVGRLLRRNRRFSACLLDPPGLEQRQRELRAKRAGAWLRTNGQSQSVHRRSWLAQLAQSGSQGRQGPWRARKQQPSGPRLSQPPRLVQS